MATKMIKTITTRRQLLQFKYVRGYMKSKLEPVREEDYLEVIDIINPFWLSPVKVYNNFMGRGIYFSLTLEYELQDIIKKCGIYSSTDDADVISVDTAPLVVNQFLSSQHNALFTICDKSSEIVTFAQRTNSLAVLGNITGELCVVMFQPKMEYTNINILNTLFKEFNIENWTNYNTRFVNTKLANILAMTPIINLQQQNGIIANFSKPIAPVNLSNFSYNNIVYKDDNEFNKSMMDLFNGNIQPTSYNSNEIKIHNKAPLFISLMGTISKIGQYELSSYEDIFSFITNSGGSRNIGILNGRWKIGIKRNPKLVSTDNKLPISPSYTNYICSIINGEYLQLQDAMIYFKYFFIYQINAWITIKKKLTSPKQIEIYLHTDTTTTTIFSTTINPDDPRNNVGQSIDFNLGMNTLFNNQWFKATIDTKNFIGGFASITSNMQNDDNFNSLNIGRVVVSINTRS